MFNVNSTVTTRGITLALKIRSEEKNQGNDDILMEPLKNVRMEVHSRVSHLFAHCIHQERIPE